MKIWILQHKHLPLIPAEIFALAQTIICCELVVKDKHGLIDTTVLEHLQNPRAR